jgi:hypothetical protein
MANPARKYDPEYDPDPRLAQDPFNPAVEPFKDSDRPELMTDAEAEYDPRQGYVEPRRSVSTGVFIAAALIVLAGLAFIFFAPGATDTGPPPPAETTTTAPADTTPAPAPETTPAPVQ